MVVAALGLAGCWFQPGYSPARSYANPTETQLTAANVSRLAPVWSTTADGLRSDPLVTGSAVVTGAIQGNVIGGAFVVQARGRGAGELLWRREMPVDSRFVGSDGMLLSAGPDRVLVGIEPPEGGGRFLELDPATGATLASVSEPASVDLDQVVVTETALVYARLDPPAGTDQVVVRDRATLAVTWTGRPLPFRSGRPALVSQGRVYTEPEGDGAGTTSLLAYDLAGCGAAICDPVATLTVPRPSFPASFLDADLVAATDDGILLVHRRADETASETSHHDLLALTAAGGLTWTRPGLGLDRVATRGDTVYAAGGDLEAIDAASGADRWRSGEIIPSQPVVAGGLVYVLGPGTSSVALHAFAAGGCGGAATCAPLAVVETGLQGSSFVGVTVSLGAVFVNSQQDDRNLAFAPSR